MTAYLESSPDAALLTLVAGVLLIYFECNRPGSIVPGCFGALLTLFSIGVFARMPLRPSALALAVAGCILIFAELAIPARNAIAATGTAVLILGLRMLLQPFAPFRVHTPTAIFAGVILAASTFWLARIALRARRNKLALVRVPTPHRID